MTDLDTMIRTCLEERAEQAPTYDDPVTGAYARSRRITHRHLALIASATAAVVAAGVTVGVAVSAGHPAGKAHTAVLAQGSARPKLVMPKCPSGQVPNLAVNKNATPRPLRALAPQGSTRTSISFVVGNGVVFLVNGKPPAPHALWMLVRPAGSAHTRYFISKPGSMSLPHRSAPETASDDAEDVNGWLATFTGCRSAGS